MPAAFPECTCLASDAYEGELLHAARCPRVQDDWNEPVDHDDIRELAELAAMRDIDTALHIYRNYRAKAAR